MMTTQELKKQHSLHRALLFATVFAFACLLTAFTPLIADDFNYAFSWATETRIDNFGQVISSMKAHRTWTHGRVFAQGWVTLFMMWPRWMFPLSNGLVITLFLWETERYFRFRAVIHSVLASAVLGALIWFCMPAFGQVFLWLDGACNYFWGAALGWALIVEVMTLDLRRYPNVSMLLLVLPTFAVGAWSEHISFAVLLMLSLLLFRSWFQNKRFPYREAILLLSGMLGYLFLMLAPPMLPSALKKRALYAAGEHATSLFGTLKAYWLAFPAMFLVVLILFLWLRKKQKTERLAALTGLALAASLAAVVFSIIITIRDSGAFSLFSSTPVGFFALTACFLAGLRKAFIQRVDSVIILDAIALTISGLGALLLFLFAMYIPARGFCAPTVFMGIASGLLWGTVRLEKPKIALGLLILVFAVFFAVGFSDIWSLHRQAEKREADSREALQNDGILLAEPYSVRTKYAALYGLQDLTPGENWPNDIIKEYYGLKEIRVEAKE